MLAFQNAEAAASAFGIIIILVKSARFPECRGCSGIMIIILVKVLAFPNAEAAASAFGIIKLLQLQ